MSKRWYVVHAYSGFEQQVRKALVERIARAEMQDRFGDVLVPKRSCISARAMRSTSALRTCCSKPE